MKEEARAIRVAPWMHIITAGGGLPLDELLPASGSVYVARLNGHDMPDEVSVFQQFSERLKFPEYFGWNWNALYDCLRDLQWLSSDYHILIIESTESVLSGDGGAREEFFRSLWRAGQRWSYTKRPEGVTLSKFSVVLSCDEGSASRLAGRLGEFQDQSRA
ncbi:MULTISPECIES: barstar family protein [unclassified Streptomyces]|uniref:barstar family protein n=1 Tax=unclassified Streptomyces TaxID=2593676 RepID=UPI001300F55F|nr:barstar family protein [Streptomyces sp. TSRI0281]